MLKTYEINLDIEREIYTPSNILFNVSRNDLETIELQFKISQDENPMNLTGSTVELAVKKPSGLTVYQLCEVTNAEMGEAKTTLSVQAYVEYGIHKAEIYVRNITQMAVTTPFYYQSHEAIMETEEVESINDWSALQEALFAYDLKPVLITGIPDFVPEYIGQIAFDIGDNRAFIAYDLTGTGWQILGAGEGGGAIVSWADILGKPLTYPPESHVHNISSITGLQAALDSKVDDGELAAPTAHTHEIADVNGLTAALNGKAPVLHNHQISEVSGLQAALDSKADDTDLAGKADTAHTHDYTTGITGKPSTFPPSAHTHTIANVTNLQTTLNNKTDVGHSHVIGDITDLQTALDSKSGTGHGHVISDVANLQTSLDSKVDDTELTNYYTKLESDAKYALKGDTGGTVEPAAWGDITGILADQTDLQTALNGKSDTGHTHTTANITDFAAGVAGNIPAEYVTDTELTTTLGGYATDSELTTGLAGKADTGHTHTVANITDFAAGVSGNIPAEYLTQTEGDARYALQGEYLTMSEGDLRYAFKGEGGTGGSDVIVEDNLTSTSTAAALSANQGRILNETKAALDHNHDATYSPIGHGHEIADVNGLSTALAGKADDTEITTINTTLGTKAPLASPALTGTPTAPTAATGTNTTQIATTAFVKAQGYLTSAPVTSVAGKTGAVTVTASDVGLGNVTNESKATMFTNAALTGAPTAPTPAAADNTTKIATTAFVKGQGYLTSAPVTSVNTKTGAVTVTASDVGLGNVTNESKATMFSNPTFTGTATGATVNATVNLQEAGVNLTDKYADITHSHDFNSLTNIPVDFPAEAHFHAMSDVTGLETALAGKADDSEIATLQPRPVVSGSVPTLPTITPTHVGQMVIDDVQKRTFIAEGPTSADWRRLAGTNYVDTATNYIQQTVLQNRKIWAGTQASYNAIATKDANTLYFITS